MSTSDIRLPIRCSFARRHRTRRRAAAVVAVLGVAPLLAAAPAGAADLAATTPTPQPLWQAYPLNAPRSTTTRPAQARPRQRASAGGKSSGGGDARQIAGSIVVAIALAVAAAALYRRRSGRASPDGREDSPTVGPGPAPAPLRDERPPREGLEEEGANRPAHVPAAAPGGVASRTPGRRTAARLSNARARNVIVDLLGAAGARGPAATTADDELVVYFCTALASATTSGEIEWSPRDGGTYSWERAFGSLEVRNVNGGPHALDVYDWNGTLLETLTPASFPGQPVLPDVLADVYAAAAESASRAYEPLDAIIDALRNQGPRG
jgi:hypothetical protein